ncbi:GH25 family lysozyme [Corynebacterium falsenii]|uniref:GH25 family lysozyme n=1 Tax=Corynebacterium falsenii TaxID=108486 RepID=UPI001DB8CAE7|nr:GH25 family lysozyme [Corynebacterium falsenii]HJF12518.1 peptidoglycan DD-metalloendopeptidase family protein [Corynebacterium falsenii]
MPVPKGFHVTSPFGQRTGQYSGMHWGTDFGNGGGAGGHPVYAVKNGTVTRAGAATGFGQWVTLDHPASNGGGETIYGHVIPEVKAGQQVREGQRIARINPDSRTNGGVAPHLHLEWHRYSWVVPGPDRLDPMTKLSGAKWVGDTAPTPGGTVTTFGVDISSHQNGFALRQAKAAGAEFAIIKATEGHTYRDPVFHSHMKDARANGMLVAAYLYVWHNSTADQMADTFAKHVSDTSVPVILDVENNSGSSVQLWKDTIAALKRRGYHSPLIYLPNWYWKNIGSPSLAGLPPLWTSNYPSGGGEMKALYGRAGAGSGPGWAGYGGLPVKLWQFTEAAAIGGWKVDGNAFKGTHAELSALLAGKSVTTPTSEEDTMTPDQERMLREVHHQLLHPWKQLGNKTLVDAVAEMRTEMRLAGDQLAGSGRDKDGRRTFAGWDQGTVLEAARRKGFSGLTLVEAVAVLLMGTDEDVSAARAVVKNGE